MATGTWWQARGWALACVVAAVALAGCAGPAARASIATGACTRVTAAAPVLAPPQRVQTLAGLPASPYAVAVGGRWAFVSYPGGPAPGSGLISVLSLRGATARVVRTTAVAGEPMGVILAGGGRVLLVANYLGGLVVLRTRALESGRGRAQLARLPSGGVGADEVVAPAGGSYAFVPEEESSDVAVYYLGGLLTGRRHRAGHSPPREVGSIPVGASPSGITVASGGRLLYVVSQGTGFYSNDRVGELTAIDVATAEHAPARAVIGTVRAGCDPVRVALPAPSRSESRWSTRAR